MPKTKNNVPVNRRIYFCSRAWIKAFFQDMGSCLPVSYFCGNRTRTSAIRLIAQQINGIYQASPVTVFVPADIFKADMNSPDVAAVAPVKNFAMSSILVMLSTGCL